MSEPKINVALTERDLVALRYALYGNLDTSYEPTLRRAERLHGLFGDAIKALRLQSEAEAIQSKVAV